MSNPRSSSTPPIATNWKVHSYTITIGTRNAARQHVFY